MAIQNIKSLTYIGEDERQALTIQQAAALVDADILLAAFDTGEKYIKIDSDYYIAVAYRR